MLFDAEFLVSSLVEFSLVVLTVTGETRRGVIIVAVGNNIFFFFF